MIENRECIIYEIIGRKVGSSVQGEKRPQEQLAEGETYRILQVIPANELTVRECWETECEWQMRLGYPVEHEGNWTSIMIARYPNHPWATDSAKNNSKTRMTERNKSKKARLRSRELAVKMNTETVANGTHPWQSPDHRALLSSMIAERNKISNREIVTCPHCNKTGMKSGMQRWHFDRCKEK